MKRHKEIPHVRTLEQVARIVGITKQNAQQIEKRALEKMRVRLLAMGVKTSWLQD